MSLDNVNSTPCQTAVYKYFPRDHVAIAGSKGEKGVNSEGGFIKVIRDCIYRFH